MVLIGRALSAGEISESGSYEIVGTTLRITTTDGMVRASPYCRMGDTIIEWNLDPAGLTEQPCATSDDCVAALDANHECVPEPPTG
jgi:hypothetical protein